MKWSDFTLNNYKKLNKIDIIKNELLIEKMNKDKENIINSKNVDYKIYNSEINKNLIEDKSNIKWVYQKGLINDLNNLKSEVEIKWNNNIIYLKCNENKLNNIVNRLQILLKVINYINNNNNKLIIYLILSNLKKDYVQGELKLEAKHINSGYTDTKKRDIFIWREEEFEKVLFHEIIHCLDKDHRVENYVLDKFNNHSFYEALTDVKAIYYNIIYLSILSNEKIRKLMKIELYFMVNQANLINNLLNNNYKAISPVLSYYILKCKIYVYLFSKFMNENLYNKIFINNEYGNELIKIIFNNELIKINYIHFKSTRMTILELN